MTDNEKKAIEAINKIHVGAEALFLAFAQLTHLIEQSGPPVKEAARTLLGPHIRLLRQTVDILLGAMSEEPEN